jgi:hypothetical protein
MIETISKAKQQGRKKTLEEIITLRSAYVYDDYSSLYQQSGKIWTEYADVEGKFLKRALCQK